MAESGALGGRPRGKRVHVMGKSQMIRKLPASAKPALILLGSLALLSVFYLGVALNVPYEADHASMMVMAKSMLEGNLLLKGWTLGNQAYYTTELPFYMAGILALGFSWKVIYVLTGLHWALIALLVIAIGAMDKMGRITPGKVFILLCLSLYLPALLLSSKYLSDAHLVGFSYCLICLLSIRNIEQTGRWPHYVVFAGFLTLAMIGDTFAVYLMAIPVLVVCLIRILAYGPQRQTVGLLTTTMLSGILSRAVLELSAFYGGARIPGPPTVFVSLPALGDKVYLFLQNAFDLFAVRFFGQPVASQASAIGLVHFSGMLLFAVAVYKVAIRIGHHTLYTQVAVSIILINVLENLFSGVGLGATRYLAPTLIFGILLVGQVVFESAVFKERRNLVLSYFLILLVSLIPPLSFTKPVSQADGLAKLLLQQHLTNGYGPYWRSNSTTVATAGQATVRPVLLSNSESIAPCPCFSENSWYGSYANFLVVQTDDSSGLQPSIEQATRIFGEPLGKYTLGAYGYLLVWDHNITPYLLRP